MTLQLVRIFSCAALCLITLLPDTEGGSVEMQQSTRSRPVTVYFLRHAEGTHNLAAKRRKPGESRESVFRDPSHFDAMLTDKGIEQSKNASTHMPAAVREALNGSSASRPLLVLTSTLSRTVETARHAMPALKSVTAIEHLREWGGAHVCDGRMRLSDFKAKYEGLFDGGFRVIGDDEEDPLGPSAPREKRADVERRCGKFLETLERLLDEKDAAGEDPVVVVVSHSAFLRHLFAYVGVFDPPSRGLKNCEWREANLSLPVTDAPPESPVSPIPLSRPSDNSGGPSSEPEDNPLPHGPHAKHYRVPLDTLLEMDITEPCSLLTLPPLSPASDEDTPARETPESTSCDSLSNAHSRLRGWMTRHEYLEAGSPRKAQESLKGSMGRQLKAVDATSCLSAVEGEDVANGIVPCAWEVVAKERVHRQTCVLLVLAGSPGAGVLEAGSEADREVECVREILRSTAGADEVYRVDVEIF
ncbi:unnamed protein product [Vitrella brassicaformis CCMP3155]|uniref:Uncharacterized protein n=1 Tax=Vitrella brassicaformis (strain CCMP3155) TaxID=1169540 RepID=A0A0G4EM68_VITBC|nr:unnamed protein product [Vitrella brassicaformis CCMP3155]|eukprot:CEL98069.1 unnamed protein product [Vitrella brassicaformis CCMP3155]